MRAVVAGFAEQPHVADLEAAHERELPERLIVAADLLRDRRARCAVGAGSAEAVEASVIVKADLAAPLAERDAGFHAEHRRVVVDHAVVWRSERKVSSSVPQLHAGIRL